VVGETFEFGGEKTARFSGFAAGIFIALRCVLPAFALCHPNELAVSCAWDEAMPIMPSRVNFGKKKRYYLFRNPFQRQILKKGKTCKSFQDVQISAQTMKPRTGQSSS
jgi:hypothetical protein